VDLYYHIFVKGCIWHLHRELDGRISLCISKDVYFEFGV